MNAASTPKKGPCKSSLSACPLSGCAEPSSADGVENILKHHQPPVNEEKLSLLTVEDFIELQCQTDARFGKQTEHLKSSIKCPQRATSQQTSCKSYRAPSKAVRAECLTGFQLSGQGNNKKIGEGNYAQLTGFLAIAESTSGPPKANSSGESVNCRLKGTDNNDFHINVVSSPTSKEFDGVVVEMIPQERDAGWTLPKLKQAQKNKMQVRIRGHLMLDNKHRVNGLASDDIGGQPKRSSLWELHPVMAFDVCIQKKCSANSDTGWEALEDWKGGK
jgi:hypothetical protein